MRNPLKAVGGLEPEQRNVVAAVAVAAITLLTLTASYNYVIADMLQGLDATDNQTDMARQIPSIGALLVIFVAGAIGHRVGARRVMVVCGILYTLGSVIIAIAGMEGALASVIGGLVSCPVIAVPTSVGYGASFGGVAALLAMLNSCASGVSVVNIDNGFGAAYQASLINHLSAGASCAR